MSDFNTELKNHHLFYNKILKAKEINPEYYTISKIAIIKLSLFSQWCTQYFRFFSLK